jgi:hypothetical protein
VIKKLEEIKLPCYPRVTTNNDHVIVNYRDGSHEIYSVMESPESAEAFAKELEVYLKAIEYVSERIQTHVSVLRESLDSVGLSDEEIESVIYEGWMNQLPVRNSGSVLVPVMVSEDFVLRLKDLEDSIMYKRQQVESILRKQIMEKYLQERGIKSK